ncbi:hypothetical protein D6D10_07150 [Aureobasidium pullulans]|uniref:Beta-xylosidase C-terminal Concanavalin A-like domain-containing protein n=1 Tax=Aureobasidium pullulans TaxID=5580 RepID=A0A4S9EQ70_AURPU|nr:hypothetical protein D6D10_07150 [Aureobasidium pullulans]
MVGFYIAHAFFAAARRLHKQINLLIGHGGIFAPTIRYNNGTFYIVTTYADTFLPFQQNSFIITTGNIFSNNWTQPMYLDQAGIVPDLFWDTDGTVYLNTGCPESGPEGGNSTFWQSELDLTTGHSLTQPKLIYRSYLPAPIRLKTSMAHNSSAARHGWPLANDGKLITLDMWDPNLPSQSNVSKVLVDDFSSPSLQLGRPSRPWWRIENDSLVLRGTVATLSALDGMALVLRKQDALFYDFSVDMSFNPTLPTHEAGIVAWVNDLHHNTISLVQCQDQTNATCLRTLTTVGERGGEFDGNTTTIYYPLPTGLSNTTQSKSAANVRLHIRATPETYQLGYSMPSDNATTWLTAYTASWMAPHYEDRISWQGARMGMYATGNGVVMLEEAVFRNVEVVRGPY